MIGRRGFVVGVAATALSVGAARAEVETDAEGRPFSHPMVGRSVPAISAMTAAGRPFTNADLRHKWTVLDFWGIWCSDCMRDAPQTEALATAVAQDSALQMVGIHVGERTGRWPSVAAYLAEKSITYTNVLDTDRTLYKAFEMQWVPTYLVVSPRGVVRGFRTDMSTEAAPEGGVKTFMKQIASLRTAHA